MTFIMNPADIEKRSFEIITAKLDEKKYQADNLNVIKRVIHATADFDYAENLVFSDGATAIACDLLRCGAQIVTDTQMAKSGINKKAAALLGCGVHCFIDAPEVAQAALAGGFTRSRAAVDRAAAMIGTTGTVGVLRKAGASGAPSFFVVGNAPTALIRLHELIDGNIFAPDFIVAVPVGFVNVVESKELILSLKIPHIVARGRKGGSNVAAAICNALLYEAGGRQI